MMPAIDPFCAQSLENMTVCELADSQLTQAFFDFMQHVIGPLPQQLQSVCGGEVAVFVHLSKNLII